MNTASRKLHPEGTPPTFTKTDLGRWRTGTALPDEAQMRVLEEALINQSSYIEDKQDALERFRDARKNAQIIPFDATNSVGRRRWAEQIQRDFGQSLRRLINMTHMNDTAVAYQIRTQIAPKLNIEVDDISRWCRNLALPSAAQFAALKDFLFGEPPYHHKSFKNKDAEQERLQEAYDRAVREKGSAEAARETM